MHKQELLDAVADGIRAKTVTKSDVLNAVDRGMDHADHAHRSLKMSEILYYIGGGIVFLGICIMIAQSWEEFSPLTRILVTFGSGIAAYCAGVAFIRVPHTERVGQAFFFIAALVLPLGLFVTLDQAGYQTHLASTNVLVSGVLSIAFLASYWGMRKNVFLLFSILYCTWLFLAVTSWLAAGHVFTDSWWRYYAYRFLVVGVSYVLLGYGFRDTDKDGFTGFLYGMGSFLFLGAALSLGGWTPSESAFWELVFPGLVFGIMFISVHLRAKSFLVFGSGYLMVYILKITSEYFSNSLGWPLALVLAGLALIAVGYGAVRVNNKYLS